MATLPIHLALLNVSCRIKKLSGILK